MKKIPLFLVLMVLVIAPLSLSGMEGRGEDHDSADNNGYNQNQSGSTVSSYVPNQDEDVGLEGDDRGGENNSGQTPSDRQHCEKTKQKPNLMNIHNTDPNESPTLNSAIPESGAGGGAPNRTGEMGGHVIQQVDPLAGIPNNKIAAWMNARTEERRKIAFDDITGKNSSSAASTLMPQDQQERVLAALNVRREQYNTLNAVPTWLQTLSNPVAAAWSYFEPRGLSSISRVNAPKDLEAILGPLDGVSPDLLKKSIVVALQNNGKLEGDPLELLLRTMNAARPPELPIIDPEQLQQKIERRVMKVSVKLANHLLADADAALLESFFRNREYPYPPAPNPDITRLIRQAKQANNIKSALLFRKSARHYELIWLLFSSDIFGMPCSESSDGINISVIKNNLTKFKFSNFCNHYSQDRLRYSARSLEQAGIIRAEAESNSDEEIKFFLIHAAEAYEADADIAEAHTNMNIKLCNDGCTNDRRFMFCLMELRGGLFDIPGVQYGWEFLTGSLDVEEHIGLDKSRYLYCWTKKLIEELSAAQTNQKHIEQYKSALLNMDASFECYRKIQNIRYNFLSQNANNFPNLLLSFLAKKMRLVEVIHQLPGQAEYQKAQELFDKATNKYLEGDPDEGRRLSEEAENAKNEAQQLDPTFEHVSLK